MARTRVRVPAPVSVLGARAGAAPASMTKSPAIHVTISLPPARNTDPTVPWPHCPKPSHYGSTRPRRVGPHPSLRSNKATAAHGMRKVALRQHCCGHSGGLANQEDEVISRDGEPEEDGLPHKCTIDRCVYLCALMPT